MSEPLIRRATRADVPAIAALLADDFVGASREGAPPADYERGFDAVNADPNQLLAVVESDGEVVGTMQITFVPSLSRGGRWRGHIEAVRVASAMRGQRIGEAMMAWAEQRCRERHCIVVELTSDQRRDGAHRFYDRLGYAATHVGFKKKLG
jgi:GNAT superfamily N-acetyltransferase